MPGCRVFSWAEVTQLLKLSSPESSKTPALKGEITKVSKAEPKVHFVQKTIGNDTYLVMAQPATQLEDEWSNLYFTTANQTNLFLMPPFEPNVLMNIANTNNTLLQCIEAMEVNVDSTGSDFVAIDDDTKIDKSEKADAQGFFNEPYPNTSFTHIRRKLRRQMEQVGYGFLEVLRNVEGDLMAIRNVDTQHVRFVKLDGPVQVQKTLTRNGKEIKLTLWIRERRFAQRIALKQLIYYKEYGVTRKINRETGDWETPDKPIAPEMEGTELLCFGIHPDVTSPYFLPRWVNELPSAIGSRKAEEQNLQFLDSGGLPPAIIFVQGGTLAKDASDQLRTYLSGANKNKYRAVVVEAQSSSGSLDAASNVQVKTERFGSSQASDAMFMKYDDLCERHIQKGFRLPPLFLGSPEEYNMATAITSYEVAEEQVFQPCRAEFDAIINATIMKELGYKTIKIRSNPIVLKDVQNQLAGMGLAKDLATRDSMLKEINDASGTNLDLAAIPQPDSVTATYAPDGTAVTSSTVDPGAKTVSQTQHGKLPASFTMGQMQPKPAPTPMGAPPGAPGAAGTPGAGPKGPSKAGPAAKTPGQPKKAVDLIHMSHEYAAACGLVAQKRDVLPGRAVTLKAEVEALSGDERVAFDSLLAAFVFGSDSPDLVGIAHDSL